VQRQAVVPAGQTLLSFVINFIIINFNQQRLRADTATTPPLHKALHVVGNAIRQLSIFVQSDKIIRLKNNKAKL